MFRKLCFKILYLFYVPHLFHFLQRGRHKIPILLFHDVTPTKNPYTGSITPEEFEQIIVFLKYKYTIGKLSEIKNAKITDCFITFDDGMTNFYKYAYPILVKHQIPATLFIPPECIDSGYTWNLKYFDLLMSNRIEEPINVQKKAYPEIRELLKEEKSNVSEKNNLMTWEELKQLDQNLIQVQSHSNEHTFLSLLSENELKRDLRQSKILIEEKLKNQVNSIAYPMGDFNQLVLEIAKISYEFGYITKNRMVKMTELNQKGLQIPRFHIDNPDKFELYARINEIHELLIYFKNGVSNFINLMLLRPQ